MKPNNTDNSVLELPNTSALSSSDAAFQLAFDDYIQLSPIGLFPHPRGLQNVDQVALDNLVKNFNSFFSRLGRRFAGIPFYVGHPDVQGYENSFTDRKAYGWIMELQVRDDGLYGRTKWSDAGRDLIANGHYKFLSPTWTAETIGTQNGRTVFRPTHLLSVGLTNEPNLPVPPLANSHDNVETGDTLLGTALPLPARAETSHATFRPGIPGAHRLTSLPTDRPVLSPPPLMANALGCGADHSGLVQPASQDSTAPGPAHMENSTAFNRRLLTLESTLENCQRQILDLQQRLVTSVLDNAITTARILPAERQLWEDKLSNNFTAASAALANAKPQLNLDVTTDRLSPGAATSLATQKSRRIHSLVQERIRREGLTYDTAWAAVKEDHPDLFQS